MRSLILCALFISAPTLALAEPVKVAPEAPFSVTVEALTTTKSSGKKSMMEEGFSVGGYDFYSKLTSEGRPGGFLLLTKMYYKVNVAYRFTKSDQTALLSGKCLISSETHDSVFGLVNDTTFGGLYGCKINDMAVTDYALEVSMPPVKQKSFSAGAISIGTNHADEASFSNTKAKLLYKGVTYEAQPTSYDTSRTFSRMIDGFVFTRDGQPVGRVDFGGNNRDKGTITAPVSEADGREAVIFFAANLLAMPDLNAGYMRSMLHLD